MYKYLWIVNSESFFFIHAKDGDDAEDQAIKWRMKWDNHEDDYKNYKRWFQKNDYLYLVEDKITTLERI